MENLKEGQVLKDKHSARLIKVIAVHSFKNTETGKEETFCSYYSCGLLGTDLLENIESDYE